MSRQLDLKIEVREENRREEFVKSVEFGIAGTLRGSGIELLGYAIRYSDFNCLMTVKADIDGVRSVAFVGSDTIMNCFLKVYYDARNESLRWREDQYHSSSI